AYEAAGHADSAVKHYELAIAGAPDHLPAIRGARCALLTRGDYEPALAMLDAEERLTSSPARKAKLLLVKGHLLDDRINDPRRAARGRAVPARPGPRRSARRSGRGDRRADRGGRGIARRSAGARGPRARARAGAQLRGARRRAGPARRPRHRHPREGRAPAP